MGPPDALLLADALAGRFGVAFKPTQIAHDGGRWPAVRPANPEEPNGFAVAVAFTPRTVTAQFYPDRFSGALLRLMADALPEQRARCREEVEHAEANEVRVVLDMDGMPIRAIDLIASEWRRLDVECTTRFVSGGTSRTEGAMRVTTACVAIVLALLPLEETVADLEPGIPEGAKMRAFVNRYERSPINRARCLTHYGFACAGCTFDFERSYGPLGARYAEVHHRVPVSALGGSYVIDPVKDLIPLCANCHAMVHRRTPPLSIEELRHVLAQRRT